MVYLDTVPWPTQNNMFYICQMEYSGSVCCMCVCSEIALLIFSLNDESEIESGVLKITYIMIKLTFELH